jgi:hypothetical protein
MAPTSAALVKPPWLILAAAAICALASLVLFAGDSRATHWIGYVLGTFVTIFSVALYRRADASRSSSPLYSPVPSLSYVALVVLTIGLASGIGHIYYIAQRVTG